VKSSLLRYWPTYLAITAVLGATLLEWYWAWGLIFFIWSIRAIRERQTTLIQDIAQDEAPVLFWTLTVLWIVLSVLLILQDVLRLFGGSDV